jgi:hypothetical protein
VAGSLCGDLLAELSRKQHGRDDVLRGLGKSHGRGPLIDRQIPRPPCFIEAGVLGNHDLAFQR